MRAAALAILVLVVVAGAAAAVSECQCRLFEAMGFRRGRVSTPMLALVLPTDYSAIGPAIIDGRYAYIVAGSRVGDSSYLHVLRLDLRTWTLEQLLALNYSGFSYTNVVGASAVLLNRTLIVAVPGVDGATVIAINTTARSVEWSLEIPSYEGIVATLARAINDTVFVAAAARTYVVVVALSASGTVLAANNVTLACYELAVVGFDAGGGKLVLAATCLNTTQFGYIPSAVFVELDPASLSVESALAVPYAYALSAKLLPDASYLAALYDGVNDGLTFARVSNASVSWSIALVNASTVANSVVEPFPPGSCTFIAATVDLGDSEYLVVGTLSNCAMFAARVNASSASGSATMFALGELGTTLLGLGVQDASMGRGYVALTTWGAVHSSNAPVAPINGAALFVATRVLLANASESFSLPALDLTFARTSYAELTSMNLSTTMAVNYYESAATVSALQVQQVEVPPPEIITAAASFSAEIRLVGRKIELLGNASIRIGGVEIPANGSIDLDQLLALLKDLEVFDVEVGGIPAMFGTKFGEAIVLANSTILSATAVGRKLVVELEAPGEIAIAAPPFSVEAVYKDGKALCLDPSACEALRDPSTGLLVFDPSTVEVVLAEETTTTTTTTATTTTTTTAPAVSATLGVVAIILVILLIVALVRALKRAAAIVARRFVKRA